MSHSPQAQNTSANNKILLLSRAFANREMPEYPTVIDPARVTQSLDQVLEGALATGGEPGVQSYVRFLQFIERYLKSSANATRDLELK